MNRIVYSFRRYYGRWIFKGIWAIGLGVIGGMAGGVIPFSSLGIAAIVLGLCITIAIGVMNQRCGFFALPWNGAPGVSNHIALTFDDGPDPQYTPQILGLLAQSNQRATFFVIGHKVAQFPELAQRIIQEGHEIGNHSMNHYWHMSLWPTRKIKADLQEASNDIQRITGNIPKFFRAPAAVLSPRIAQAARQAELILVGYSVRSGDGSKYISANRAQRRLLRGMKGGTILLLHDVKVGGRPPVSMQVLPELLQVMRERKLKSITLSQLWQLESSPNIESLLRKC